jgi:TolB-like protein
LREAGLPERDYEDLGEQEVKNIAEPVRAYRVVVAGDEDGATMASRVDPLPLPDKPSIAVLPFENMSADQEQEYFADGMAEDIITALSRYRWFFVIARNSSFTYKGRAVDVTQVGQELGVRYVLEGSVRKSGNRIRVSAQLIDAETGNHIWAQSYDRVIEDIFALQDEIGDTIVASVTPEIGHVEQDRAQRKPPENLNAWDLYQRGLAANDTTTEDGLASAIELFGKVHQLDPSFAPAFAMEADSLIRYMLLFQPEDSKALIDQARKQAHKGMALAPRDPICLWADGRVHSILGKHDIAISRIEQAIVLNPNYALAYFALGAALVFAGRAEKAISHLDHAMRLSPQDSFLGGFQHMRAAALFSLKQYEECVEWARRAAHSPNPRGAWTFAFLSAALTKLGREDEAQFALDEAIARAPNFSLSSVRWTPNILDKEAQERLLEALGDAGLPE